MEYRLLVDLEVIEVMDKRCQKRSVGDFLPYSTDYGRSRAIIQITMKPMLSGDGWKSVSFRPGRSTTGLMALIGM
jgi:hypothetical protein